MATERGRRVLWLSLWLLAVLAGAEAAVRATAPLLRRDRGFRVLPGAHVVYCIGDSFTSGLGVEADDAWPRVLERLLREEVPGRRLDVRSLAEPGLSSTVATWLVAKALKAGDPRLLLILTGWNANDGDFADHAEERTRRIPWASTVDGWLEHSRLFRLARETLASPREPQILDQLRLVPQTTAMTLYDFRAHQEIALRNLRQIAAMCHVGGVPCAFLTYPHQSPTSPDAPIEPYHPRFDRTPLSEDDYLVHDRKPDEIAIDAIIRQVGTVEGVPVIDLQPVLDDQRKDVFLEDLQHPNAAGHRLIARVVMDAIGPLLTPGKTRD